MKKQSFTFLFAVLMSMVGTKAFAYDLAVENADGVTIYYNYINDGKELEVTKGKNSYYNAIFIPGEVTFMNRTRKVTSICDWTFSDSYVTSVTIPNTVARIGKCVFRSCRLTSITIPNSVTSIGDMAFYDCSSLTSVTIPNSVTSIGEDAFFYCSGLTSVHISDIEAWCKIEFSDNDSNPLSYAHHLFLDGKEIMDLVIPNSVTSIGHMAFYGCSSLTSVTIGNSVTSIGHWAFYGCSSLTSVTIGNSVTSIGALAFNDCSSLTSVTIPNSVTSIGSSAFSDCSSLTSVTIGNSVTSIGEHAFWNINIPEVISKIENPFPIDDSTFSNNTFLNATLYVPKGTIGKYKATKGWNGFAYIEERDWGTEESDTPPKPSKCEKPTISYLNGKLTFNSATEGVTYQYSINDPDIKSGSGQEVELGVTYNITVFATKVGYENSETATATLCWIDVEPKAEGISNGVANVRANAVLIHSDGGLISIEGLYEGADVIVYNMSGQKVGSARASSNFVQILTSLRSGEICIVKIGDKEVKVLIK